MHVPRVAEKPHHRRLECAALGTRKLTGRKIRECTVVAVCEPVFYCIKPRMLAPLDIFKMQDGTYVLKMSKGASIRGHLQNAGRNLRLESRSGHFRACEIDSGRVGAGYTIV